MPSTFLDLFVAKVAIQLGLLDPPGACAALRAVDVASEDLLGHLGSRLALPADTVRAIERHARRCLFLKGEAIYLRFLRERRLVSEEALKGPLWQVRSYPPDGRDVRLGELLLQRALLTAQQDGDLQAQTLEAMQRDNDHVTARYRERGYVGIEQNNQTVAEVVEAAARATPPSKALQRPAPRPDPAAVAAEPAGASTQILSADVASGKKSISSDAHAAVRPSAGRELAGDLGLSREVAVVGPAVLAPPEERTVELTPAPAPVAAPELAKTGLLEKYDVLRKLGEGGMGAVYLAFAKDDTAHERPMALKVVLDIAKSKDAAARFKREILATSMCAHENIIEIYDASETDDGSFYMAMECIEGEQLDELMKREGPVSVPRTVDFIEQALAALEAIHNANIVHRDIKPQNFRIWKDATGRERLKIMDFGIARVLDAQETGAGDQFYATMAGKITGSPAYIAPESIVDQQAVDGRADLYSLGISIFRIAAGRLPFVARTPDEFLPLHLYRKPPLLRELVPAATAELEAFAARLLEKVPTRRYQSATEALQDLREKVRPSLGADALPPPAAVGASPAQPHSPTQPPVMPPAYTTTGTRRAEETGGIEATAADRDVHGPGGLGAVVAGPATPRDPFPHEVAPTEAMTPDEAREAMAQIKATAPAQDADANAALIAEAEAAEAPKVKSKTGLPAVTPAAPATTPANPGGGAGKLVAALVVVLLLLAVGTIAVLKVLKKI